MAPDVRPADCLRTFPATTAGRSSAHAGDRRRLPGVRRAARATLRHGSPWPRVWPCQLTMLGPEANELVFLDPQKQFSSALGWGIVLDKLFPRGLMLLDFDEHRVHRRVLSVAFKAGPDAVLSCRSQRGDRERPGAMAAPARVQVLSRDQATDARPRGDFLPRRGSSGLNSGRQAGVHRHGGGLDFRHPRAAPRHTVQPWRPRK